MLLALSLAIIFALFMLIYYIRKVGPGGETFETWTDQENEEEN